MLVATVQEGFGALPTLTSALSTSGGSDDYSFHKALARALSALGDALLLVLPHLKQQLPRNFELYVSQSASS